MKLHTTTIRHHAKNCIVVTSIQQAYKYRSANDTVAKDIAALINVLSKKESSVQEKNQREIQYPGR